MFIVLLLTSLVVAFLCTRILQPSVRDCPSSEPLQSATGFEVWRSVRDIIIMNIWIFQAWILEQQQRRGRIARACSRAGQQIKTRQIKNQMFNFNEEHRLLFCIQPKVSSQYLKLFNIQCLANKLNGSHGQIQFGGDGVAPFLLFYDSEMTFSGWVIHMVEPFCELGRKFQPRKSVETW